MNDEHGTTQTQTLGVSSGWKTTDYGWLLNLDILHVRMKKVSDLLWAYEVRPGSPDTPHVLSARTVEVSGHETPTKVKLAAEDCIRDIIRELLASLGQPATPGPVPEPPIAENTRGDTPFVWKRLDDHPSYRCYNLTFGGMTAAVKVWDPGGFRYRHPRTDSRLATWEIIKGGKTFANGRAEDLQHAKQAAEETMRQWAADKDSGGPKPATAEPTGTAAKPENAERTEPAEPDEPDKPPVHHWIGPGAIACGEQFGQGKGIRWNIDIEGTTCKACLDVAEDEQEEAETKAEPAKPDVWAEMEPKVMRLCHRVQETRFRMKTDSAIQANAFLADHILADIARLTEDK